MFSFLKKKYFVYTALLSVWLIVAWACGVGSAPANRPAQVEVTEAYINTTTENGALYFEVTNQGGSADKLVGVETGAAAVAELHQTQMDENEVMQMKPLAEINVPAGETVTLEPGGLHVMLLDVKQDLAPGDKVSVTLNFEQSGSLTIEADVREGVAMAHEHGEDEMSADEEHMHDEDNHHEEAEHEEHEHQADEAEHDHADHDHGDGRIPNDGAVIRIIAPEDGMEFKVGDDILVEIEIENFELDQDGSHWHVYIDDQSWGMVVGRDTDEVVRGLDPGEYEISTYLSIGTHEELAEGDKITITVVE